MHTQLHERVGSTFTRAKLLNARDRANAAVQTIATQIEIGMREEDARVLAKKILLDLGMEREWHPTLVRFGKNTLNTFKQASEPDTRLGKNDLFFIDIGPVFDGHEGDSGATFTVGNDTDMIACATAAKTLFDLVKQQWATQKLEGKALYQYAQRTAESMGWQLNLGAPGHRIGDFPHAIYKADKLAALDFTPSDALWILEIQIRHPTKPFGAFFEDILI